MLNHACGIPRKEPDWFQLSVMRRIAIATPNVMAALRRLNKGGRCRRCLCGCYGDEISAKLAFAAIR